jgi:hypothetical protein
MKVPETRLTPFKDCLHVVYESSRLKEARAELALARTS